MSVLLDLPDVLIRDILCEWIATKDFVQLDSALCNGSLRQRFLKFIGDHRDSKGDRLRLGMREPRRGLNQVYHGTHLKLTPYDSSEYGERNDIVEAMQYAMLRGLSFSELHVDDWPYTLVDSVWQPVMDNVRDLVIHTPFKHSLRMSSNRLRVYRNFRNIEGLRIDFHSDQCWMLSLICGTLRDTWPRLRKLRLNSSFPTHMSMHMDKDISINKPPRDSFQRIPPALFESLSHVFSRLTVLSLDSIILYPIHLITIFGKIDMPLLEKLSLSGCININIPFPPFSEADYKVIDVEGSFHSSSHPPGASSVQAIDDRHDVSYVFAEEDSDIHHHMHHSLIGREDEEDDSDDDDIDGSGSDESMDTSWKVLLRECHRPRRRITKKIHNLDDVCGYFAQERVGKLPRLKYMRGCAQYIYPLIPLATADAFRTLDITPTGSEIGSIMEMDALYGMHFPSLANVAKLDFHLSHYRISDDWRAPMDVLLMNMPRVEEINCEQAAIYFRKEGIASAILALDQPLSSLRSLKVLGVQARNAKEFHAAIEKLHIVAPNLKSLTLAGPGDDHRRIPFRFHALRHSVQLEHLSLSSFTGDYLMKYPPVDSDWHFRTDLLYLRHLVRLKEVSLRNVPAWVRDEVLESIFASLPQLREFTITITPESREHAFVIDDSHEDTDEDDDEDTDAIDEDALSGSEEGFLDPMLVEEEGGDEVVVGGDSEGDSDGDEDEEDEDNEDDESVQEDEEADDDDSHDVDISHISGGHNQSVHALHQSDVHSIASGSASESDDGSNVQKDGTCSPSQPIEQPPLKPPSELSKHLILRVLLLLTLHHHGDPHVFHRFSGL